MSKVGLAWDVVRPDREAQRAKLARPGAPAAEVEPVHA